MAISGMSAASVGGAFSHGVAELILANEDHDHGHTYSHYQLADDLQLHDAGNHSHDTPSQLTIDASTSIVFSGWQQLPGSAASPFRRPYPFERPPKYTQVI